VQEGPGEEMPQENMAETLRATINNLNKEVDQIFAKTLKGDEEVENMEDWNEREMQEMEEHFDLEKREELEPQSPMREKKMSIAIPARK